MWRAPRAWFQCWTWAPSTRRGGALRGWSLAKPASLARSRARLSSMSRIASPEFDSGVVVREVAPVLDDLAELIVQRLHTVGGVDDPAQRRRELQKRDEPLRATRGRTCQVAESMGGCW